MAALPREFLLAAACCRWPLSEPAVAAIRAAAAAAIDWRYFLRVVERHRVGGLVHEAFSAARIGVPDFVAKDVAALAQAIARRNLRLAAESSRLQRDFDAAGIPVLVLKGAPLAQLAYGSLSLKHGRDIDLLVPPPAALAAIERLEGAGYALQDPARRLSAAQRRAYIAHGREVELSGGGGLRVELHWRLTDNPLLLQNVDALSPSRSVAWQGAAVRTLADDDLFAYLCAHGATHSWSRLKWLADLAALIAEKDETEIARLYRHAQDRGAGLCAGQGLMLCRRLLGRSLPPALEAALGADRRVRRLAEVAMAAMAGAEGASDGGGLAGKTRRALMQFSLGHGWGYFFAQCRIVCTGHADVIRFPLPPFLYFLYPLLRLPSWVWRHLRRAPGAPTP